MTLLIAISFISIEQVSYESLYFPYHPTLPPATASQYSSPHISPRPEPIWLMTGAERVLASVWLQRRRRGTVHWDRLAVALIVGTVVVY